MQSEHSNGTDNKVDWSSDDNSDSE